MPKKATATIPPAPVAPVEVTIPETYVTDLHTAETLAYVEAARIACTNDVQQSKKSDASARTVAEAFDNMFAFDWTKYRGNGSAKTCEEKLGMLPDDFKAVRLVRDDYKKEWEANGLTDKAFDRRWQTLKENSAFAPVKPVAGDKNENENENENEGDSGESDKTKAEQCIAALQNALRYATHEEFDGNVKTGNLIRAALKANGIAEDAE